MNWALKQFFFSNFKQQLCEEVIKGFGEEKAKGFGEIVSVSFIVTQERKFQRVKFTNYEGDADLTDDNLRQICNIFGIDPAKEMQVCKSVFAIINFPNKTINVQKKFIDGRPDETTNI